MKDGTELAPLYKQLATVPENRALILSMAAESATQAEIADVMGVSISTVVRALVHDPAFGAQYESTLFQASVQIVEQLRQIPFNESTSFQRARIQVDALARYLELRWPSRYGKRLDVTVKSADMRGALDRARQRADDSRVLPAELAPQGSSLPTVAAGSGPVELAAADTLPDAAVGVATVEGNGELDALL